MSTIGDAKDFIRNFAVNLAFPNGSVCENEIPRDWSERSHGFKNRTADLGRKRPDRIW
ncbi:hypothetical protein RsS62_15030 [Rhizobium dioscoreae]|nr:hypothetical protein RsS62_15030 [Rhizobium dioscoreae]